MRFSPTAVFSAACTGHARRSPAAGITAIAGVDAVAVAGADAAIASGHSAHLQPVGCPSIPGTSAAACATGNAPVSAYMRRASGDEPCSAANTFTTIDGCDCVSPLRKWPISSAASISVFRAVSASFSVSRVRANRPLRSRCLHHLEDIGTSSILSSRAARRRKISLCHFAEREKLAMAD